MNDTQKARIEGAYAALKELHETGIIPKDQATKANAAAIVEGAFKSKDGRDAKASR